MSENSTVDDLDEHQLAAVEYGSGPLVIVAGAGTGKTQTLTARVARLLDAGVPPERILLLTFTRRAAAAMTSRAAALCGDPALGRRICGGTFHAVAYGLIAELAPCVGLADVSVLDASDVVDLLDLLREEHGLAGTSVRLPSTRALADVYSRAINTGRPTREVMAAEFPWCSDHAEAINGLLRDFVARKRQRGLLDFDDLLIYWRALLADAATGDRLRARWDWVLVDEYQDVNRIQVDIVRLLRPDGEGLTVVGDDAQAIYGFRGADAAHLLDLHTELSDSRLVRLDRNYRSTQEILDVANLVRPGELKLTLVADREDQVGRPVLVACDSSDAEARLVADAVLAAHRDGHSLRDQAVLMRAASHSHQLEIELNVRKIPFHKFGGIAYTNTAHVRDLLAALRLALNPADELAWYRLLTRHRAVGKATARQLTTLLMREPGERYAEVVAAAPPKARSALQATFAGLGLAQADAAPVRVAEHCLTTVRPLIKAAYPDWPRRLEDVERLAATAAAQRDLRTFVAELTIDPPSSSADYADRPHLDEDYLTLSTIHSAKGLEWSAVHLLHAVDGALPSDMALAGDNGLEEEQRLFYVALTRARDTLRIYTPARMPTHPTSFGARHVLAKPSRFLSSAVRAVVDTEHQLGTGSCGQPPRSAPVRVTIPTLEDLLA